MTAESQQRLEEIGDEVERLEEAGEWNIDHFRRLYRSALEASGGDRRRLEFFGPFMPDRSYFDEAVRLSREYESAA